MNKNPNIKYNYELKIYFKHGLIRGVFNVGAPITGLEFQVKGYGPGLSGS